MWATFCVVLKGPNVSWSEDSPINASYAKRLWCLCTCVLESHFSPARRTGSVTYAYVYQLLFSCNRKLLQEWASHPRIAIERVSPVSPAFTDHSITLLYHATGRAPSSARQSSVAWRLRPDLKMALCSSS